MPLYLYTCMRNFVCENFWFHQLIIRQYILGLYTVKDEEKTEGKKD